MNFKHTLPIQIRFNDIDLAGHVYNAVYQEYFDLARVDYFKNSLGNLLSWTKTGLVIASIHIDYSIPILLTDKIEVRTKVSEIGNKSLEMIQEITKIGETAPAAIGKTILVCFNMPSRTSVEIPDSWKENIRKFENSSLQEYPQEDLK